MSTDLVIKEIRRFLASETAEVLCIKGKWGVGKTYAWRRYLGEARAQKTLKAKSYSYASLFGLNSLDDLRFAIFEGKVAPEKALTGPDVESVRALFDMGTTLGRKGRSLIGPIMSAFGQGNLGDAIAKSAFLLVRDQLVCLDDLERAGEGLKQRDVLGLASFLKEQRNCKVVLLLNDAAMETDEQKEFERLLEKVVDVSLVFEPTAAEAAAIAVVEDQPIGERLRKATTTLGVSNIRVIKKIERLSLRLAELLAPFRIEVLDQGIGTCALAGWAVLEPDHAPDLDFLRTYNSIVMAMRDRGDLAADAGEAVKWRDLLSALPFTMADDFDLVIFDGIKAGYFDEARLRAEATKLAEAFRRGARDSAFDLAWKRYHHSLAVDDNEILDGLVAGAQACLADISPLNMSGTLQLLREYGRDAEADALIADYVAALPNEREWFDLSNHHFGEEDPVDPEMAAAFDERLKAFPDDRNPEVLLLDIASGGWNDPDEVLLGKLTADEIEAMFLAAEGPNLRRVVQSAMNVARHETESGRALRAALTTALTRIAEASPLRARRLRNWGFTPPAPPTPGPATSAQPSLT